MLPRARATLGIASVTHLIHDGFSDLLYILLPLWTQEFGLTFTQTGLLKSVYTAGLAGFQIPAGIWAERVGERRLLVAGTAVTGLGFIAAALTGSFLPLLACLLAAGLGSAVQHPLSSSLVAHAYEAGPRRLALGTYNFSGDLGKMLVPAAAAFAIPWIGWRGAAEAYGAIGLLAALLLALGLARLGMGHPAHGREGESPREAAAGWGIRDARGFVSLAGIQLIDSGTRTGFLTFLPFLLIAKGATVQTVGLALMLLFAGGASGKLACGALAERIGIIRTVVLTEATTGLGILLLLGLPLSACLPLLPVVGIGLNGTSSVLYGTVADLVETRRRSRGYALFYTVGLGASALAPVLYGILSDHHGVPTTLAVVGLVAFVTIPLALLLRRPLAALPSPIA
ncbi:MAG: MFS transporter [Candidatus Rokubacteria bacterium]|nr:MFS transporter [Candidatus Rokubacteria bacterium]